MSDAEQKIPPNLLEIKEIQKYLKEVQTNPCPSCGNSVWSVISPPEGYVGFLNYHPAERLPGNGLFPATTGKLTVYAVVNAHCTKCGLIHTFSYKSIEAWKAAQKA